MRNDDEIEFKETIVTVNIGITTFAKYTLKTTKSEEEVLADIKSKGVAILDDDKYQQTDYEIDLESVTDNDLETVFYDVNGNEFEQEYLHNDD